MKEIRAKSNAGWLFVLSPVLGLIEAFKNLNNQQARYVLFAFCLCFGLCFSVGIDRYEGSIDGISMRAEFEETKGITTGQYLGYLKEYFEFDTGAQDIYIVSVAYLVSRATYNYHYFFFVLAFVFAFFQLKCLKYFTKETNFTNSTICIILVCLFLWNNIYNINGARFWTASWIGLYCIFKMFYDKKPLYIILSLITPMMHASFAVFPIVLLLGYLASETKRLLLFLFIVSWMFSIFAEDFRIQQFDNVELPFLVGKKVEAYTEMETLQGSGFYWVQLLFRSLSIHYVDLLVLLIALNRNRIIDKRVNHVVGMTIIIATLSNFGMVIPIVGGRFFSLNYTLVAYSFLVLFGDRKYQLIVYMLPFFWFMNLFYLYKDVTTVLDLGFLLSPLISFVRYTFV